MDTTNSKLKRTHSNEDSKCSPTKRQFRNENEKRRRGLFSQLINNLEDILNIDRISLQDDQIDKTSQQTNKLDKASILRETASYLRKHNNELSIETNISLPVSRTSNDEITDIVDFSWKPPSNIVMNEEWIQTAIESLHCFFLVTKSDPYNAQIVYVSKNISSLLDYSQNELINHSLFELILPRDHDRLRDYFLKDQRVLETCDLSWRRAITNEYEQCTIIGAFRQIHGQKNKDNEKYLISIVKLNRLDRTSIVDYKNSIDQFTTRINLYGRFINIDSKAREFLGYSSYELIGHTHFDFVHPDDLPIIVRAHNIWKETGNGKSDPYRFLTKGQQWVFLETHSQVQINSWTGKPESYLCTTNPWANSSGCFQKPLSHLSASSASTISSIQSPVTMNPMLIASPLNRNSSSDTQITSFLSHLGNETYRTNMRDKLNEHRIRKNAEIRVRQEEIKVIEDIIKFINEFELKHSKHILSKPIRPNQSFSSTTNVASSSQLDQTTQKESIYQNNQFETFDSQTSTRSSSLNNTIDDSSIRSSSVVSPRHNSSTTHNANVHSSKDETPFDRLTTSLFSPQQESFSLTSPLTSLSSVPNTMLIPPIRLSLSPMQTTTQKYPESFLPSNNNRTPVSLLSSSTKESNTTANTNLILAETSSGESSFDR